MSDGINSAEGRLLAVQMGAMRDDLKEMKVAMRDMASSMEKLVRIEEQQKDMRASIERAFAEIRVEREKREANEKRIAEIEKAMPGLREARGWAIGAVTSSIAMIVAALILYFVQHHII